MEPERNDIEATRIGTEEAIRLEIVQEELKVGKREVERIVRLHQRPVERTEQVMLELQSQEVEMERVPMDRFVEEIPDVREEDGVTIIPIVEEVVTVRLKLVEEVRVRRVARTRVYEEDVTLRRTDVQLQPETDLSAVS